MKMADVSMKFETIREAQAEGKIYLSKETIEMIKNKQIPKGDVITASQMAGLLGAKKTPEVLPFCHPILIDQAFVEVQLQEDGIYVKSFVRCIGRTGVEMEALTAVSAALLNVYDMCKAFDKNMVISDIKLVSKKGGKSDYEEDLSGLKCAVITLSDSCYRKEAEDKSGKVAIDIIENEFKGEVVHYEILPDDKEKIVEKLKQLTDKVDIIFTTGGTGFGKRDNTPEATKEVIEKEMIGFEEAMRIIGIRFTPKSLLSRAVCGIAGDHTLIINLPGSSSGVRDNLKMIAPLLKHAIRMAKGEKKH
ncbi:bifunctional molybdenum cofactor biosynthesis protein MoaC/MoaB [Sulfurihydrogenibium azorense]|jgi:molybdenum cofactor biosynthesis protein MoaC|uniref:cyclic pyranopterin monophosphate synthase n=1 Tax=Sulfurihydrogenibium azorense (strain DSM 15241 / OCM 825 / Az-Fu1) TaxID=204536 RepID=C1DUB4_SULAA|nr:bifunctional molybdenum cofactor biosynthesis protein MoaC/MoaB [Sulfurihydrogenibium azorense]ACN99589.1 molybdenum cofactor biosynthesis bifunctional protein: molybdenum cofactor biosynthesis protein C/molybdenum cofactor biosynthesis protein B [Sulfurihydrogenibium azorense Az-Fu1]MDM7274149.1 bifunctional molybdenum cofactor biosynthesis protein MoaC/MoaB [Sulfurihydrogenibium azorense]